jgi:hypothetical protein
VEPMGCQRGVRLRLYKAQNKGLTPNYEGGEKNPEVSLGTNEFTEKEKDY